MLLTMHTFATSLSGLNHLPLAIDAFGSGGITGLIYTLIIGLVVGVIAKLLTPGRDPGGCIITSLIGIAGSLLAYYVGAAVGHYGNGVGPGIIASVIGAVVVLIIYHAVFRRGGGGPTV